MAKKEAGGKSASQNDFLEPKAPIDVVATDVGTSRPYNNGAASVSFSLPGDSPAATSYAVYAYKPGGVLDTTATNTTGSSSPIVVEGLDANTNYYFTVTATNNAGTSAASSNSSAVLITTVPEAPSAVSAS